MDQLLEIFVPGIPPGDDLTPRVQPPEMVNSGAGEAHGVINGDVLNRTENKVKKFGLLTMFDNVFGSIQT